MVVIDWDTWYKLSDKVRKSGPTFAVLGPGKDDWNEEHCLFIEDIVQLRHWYPYPHVVIAGGGKHISDALNKFGVAGPDKIIAIETNLPKRGKYFFIDDTNYIQSVENNVESNNICTFLAAFNELGDSSNSIQIK